MWRLAGAALLLVVAAVGFGWPLFERNSSAFVQPRVTSTPQPISAPTSAPAVVAQPDPTSGSSDAVTLLSVKPKPGQDLAAPKAHETAVEPPRRLTIPSIGVDAGFEYVGLTADGAMGVPKDPSKAAWYSLGPRPGEPGNAVVAGHVDWGGKTVVFWRLRDLRAGDEVSVTAVDGKKYSFVVTSHRWYDAAAPAVDEVFGQTTDPELTLITCVGDFDRKTRQYLSRLVVRAVLR